MYKRLIKIKKRLDKVALRDPRTNQQKIDRNNWERVMTILMRRYDYGIESARNHDIMHGKMPRIRTGKLCGTGN